MAELLTRVIDKVNAEDFYQDCQCSKRGDVIVVQADGWLWGKDELSLPEYRVLQVPGLSVSEAEAMLSPELDTDPTHPSLTLQRRAFHLDLSIVLKHLPALATELATGVRAARPLSHPNFTAAVFRLAKQRKASIADPRIIGPATSAVIG